MSIIDVLYLTTDPLPELLLYGILVPFVCLFFLVFLVFQDRACLCSLGPPQLAL